MKPDKINRNLHALPKIKTLKINNAFFLFLVSFKNILQWNKEDEVIVLEDNNICHYRQEKAQKVIKFKILTFFSSFSDII